LILEAMHMRCFVAVLLGEETRLALAEAASRFYGKNPSIRLVSKDNLHVTLQFLGEVPPSIVLSLQSALQAAAGGVESFDVELCGSGAFPSARRPRVVWVGIREGAAELSELARRVARELRPLGLIPDKPFSPHITVARARGGGGGPLGSSLPPDEILARQAVRSVHLMQSELSREGARYQSLFEAQLGADSL
jgi:RNA 2',3'-cyclic 3'-phosphodiesterase